MTLPLHPAFRRLLRVGAIPAIAVERLARTPRAFELLARDFADLDILSARELEPLLRGIDLSGIAASSDRAQERTADPSGAASDKVHHPRLRLHSIGDGLAPESARAASREISSETNRDTSRDDRAFSTDPSETDEDHRARDSAVDRSRFPLTTPQPLDSSVDTSRSSILADPEVSAPETVGPTAHPSRPRVARQIDITAQIDSARSRSRAAAHEALRTRAARAGDPRIADRPISRAHAASDVVELLDRASRQPDTKSALSSRDEGRSDSRRLAGERHAPLDSIARIVRVVDDLRPRNARDARLANANQPPRPNAPDSSSATDQTARPDPSALTETGLRGLISRAAKFDRRAITQGITVERPAPIDEPEDAAQRLDEILRNEARRNGIDLARLTR